MHWDDLSNTNGTAIWINSTILIISLAGSLWNSNYNKKRQSTWEEAKLYRFSCTFKWIGSEQCPCLEDRVKKEVLFVLKGLYCKTDCLRVFVPLSELFDFHWQLRAEKQLLSLMTRYFPFIMVDENCRLAIGGWRGLGHGKSLVNWFFIILLLVN